MFRRVDLPQPDGPTRATNSLSKISNETASTAGTARAPSANVFDTSRIAIRTFGVRL